MHHVHGITAASSCEQEQLKARGTPLRAAETVLRLVFGAVDEARARRRWSDREAAHRVHQILEAVWEAYPIPEVWESIACDRFATSGARDGFKAALFNAIRQRFTEDWDAESMMLRRQAPQEPTDQ